MKREFFMAYDFKRGMKLPFEDIKDSRFQVVNDSPSLCFFVDREPLVKKGDTVLAGTHLGKRGELNIRSSVSGRVSCIEEGRITVENDMNFTPDPEIQPYGIKTGKTLSQLDFESFCELLGEQGIRYNADTPAPAFFSKAYGKVRTLTVNAVVTQNGDVAPLVILEEHAEKIVSAMKIIMSVFGIKRGIIALSGRSRHTYRHLSSLPSLGRLVRLERLGDNYPLENNNILLFSLTGKELSPLHESYVSGHLLLTVQNCLDIYDAFAGSPAGLGGYVTVNTLSGERKTVYLPYGTPLEHLFKSTGIEAQVIKGTGLSGTLADPAAYYEGESRIYTECERKERLSGLCNKCGDCVDVCPMYLYPFEFAFSGKKHAVSCGINVCLQCGLCESICPCSYPLGRKIAELKKSVSEAQSSAEGGTES